MKKTVPFLGRVKSILGQGLSGVRPAIPVRLDLLEEEARKYISHSPFLYISSGAGRENVVQKNHETFLKWSIIPQVLTDISMYDTSVTLFGRDHAYPFILGPVGALDLAHRDAEVAVGRACAAEDVAMGFSSMASTPMEKVASAMGDCTRWFQLYYTTSKSYNESLIRRAEACGCSAIVVTVDTKLIGWRTEDLDMGYSVTETFSGLGQFIHDPVFQQLMENKKPGAALTQRPAITLRLIINFIKMSWYAPGGFFRNLMTLRAIRATQTVSEIFHDPSLNWRDLMELKKITKLPILVKGILRPEDAIMAVESGMEGIIVSNHGGRQLSGCQTSLDALPAIAEAVKGRIPVLMDSGIRGGADIFKAIALGANAVLIGRPYVYALAIAGAKGVQEMIQNLKAEFDTTLLLAGCTKVSDIHRSMVVKND